MIKAIRHKDKDGLLDRPTLNFRKASFLGNHKKSQEVSGGTEKIIEILRFKLYLRGRLATT